MWPARYLAISQIFVVQGQIFTENDICVVARKQYDHYHSRVNVALVFVFSRLGERFQAVGEGGVALPIHHAFDGQPNSLGRPDQHC